MVWWLGVALLLLPALAAFLSIVFGYFWHPLVRRLVLAPEQIFDLEPGQLVEAAKLLGRFHLLESLLKANSIDRQHFQRVIRFLQEEEVSSKAVALGELWRVNLIARRGGVFVLDVGEDFLLNLKSLLLYFPGKEVDERQVEGFLETEASDAHEITLILHSKDKTQDALEAEMDIAIPWAAPTSRQITKMLLSSNWKEVLTPILARHVTLTRISPYQVGGGVNKEALFYGRKRQLVEVVGSDLSSYFVVGGRQVGKSSFLKALLRRFEKKSSMSVYFISLVSEEALPSICRLLGGRVSSDVEEVMERIAERARVEGRRQIFLLDEVDLLVAKEQREGFPLLGQFRRLSEEGICFFVMAGFWNLFEAVQLDYRSPLLNFGKSIILGALEKDACRDLAMKPMEAMGIRWESEELVEYMIQETGQRANLIGTVCSELVGTQPPGDWVITKEMLERVLGSLELRSAVEGWEYIDSEGLSGEKKLDRLIVYATINRDGFSFVEVLDIFEKHGVEVAPEILRRSLNRLELAFVLNKDKDAYFYQVPLTRKRVLEQDPSILLERELAELGGGEFKDLRLDE